MSHPRRTAVPALALILTLAAVARAADLEYPETPAGAMAASFLEVYNSADEERVRAFTLDRWAADALERRAIDERMASYRQLQGMVGVIEPRGILAAAEHDITINAFSEQLGAWLAIRLELDTEPPHKLVRIEIRPSSSPEQAARSYAGWTAFADLVAQVRADAECPALAVAVADADGIIETAVDGLRAAGGTDAALVADGFHIGSITKSMTATIIGRLVERGDLAWDVTLAEALPDVPMRDEYRGVTLRQILQHRGGIPQHMTYDDETMARLVGLPGTPVEQRGAYVAEVLQETPIAEPGDTMSYSNAGYTIAGHVAERAAGVPWETLMAESVFTPCGMKTAGLGWPATADRPDQPRGHFPDGEGVRPQELDEYPLGPFMAPAGDVHCSAADLARYGRMHLRGLLGMDGALTAETIRTLHTPPAGEEDGGYACGWVVRESGEDLELHWHNGSAGSFHASLSLYPKRGLVIAAVMNRMSPSSDVLIGKMNDAIVSSGLGRSAGGSN